MLVFVAACLVLHQVSYQRFGNGGIDTVHAHVVAVVGGPAKCQFAHVARAHHEASRLAGSVHEHLGAFARLGVFVGQVVHAGIVADVAEV